MEKYDLAFWKKEISDAKKSRKQWLEISEKIYKIYLPKKTDTNNSRNQKKIKYNIFNSNVGVLESALFSRVPKPTVVRKFSDPNNQVARVASLILERILTSELTANTNFKSATKRMIKDFLVVGLGAAYVRYDADVSNPVQLSTDTEDLAAETSEVIRFQNTDIEHILYKDFFHADADSWENVSWAARRVYMTKEEVERRFGKDKAKICNYSKSDDGEFFSDEEESVGQAEIFEIWCKESKRVYFVDLSADEILEDTEDFLQLKDFFPFCTPLLANTNTEDSLCPVSDFELLESQYKQLDTLNNRINRLTQACRLAAVYSSEHAEVKQLLESTGDSVAIPMRNYQAFVSQGGLGNAISFMDITAIANVIAQLRQEKAEVERQIEVISGISDVLRGSGGNPYESAAASQIKAQSAGVRLAQRQMQVADSIAELIQKRAELICRYYSPDQMLLKIGELAQEDQQYLQPAIAMLKDAVMANFSITVSVDALTAPEFQNIAQERQLVIQSISQLIPQAIQGATQFPELGPAFLQLMKWTVSGMKGAAEIEGVLDTHLTNLLQQQQAQAGQPKEEKPDVAMMQVQLQQQQAAENSQVKQVELQIQQQKIQMDQQIKMAELDLQKQKMDLEFQKIQLEQQKLQLEVQRIESDKQIKLAQVQSHREIEELKLQQEDEHFFMQLQSDEQIQPVAPIQDGIPVQDAASLIRDSIMSIGDLASRKQTINVVRNPDGSLSGEIE